METHDLADTSKEQANRAFNGGLKQPIRGWKMHILTFGLWMALFLSTLETTIVSTSLVSITNALNGFDKRDWVVTAYLITYTGFLTIYAKLGDIFGQKTMFIMGVGSFILFSILCGISTTIQELVIFRVFQGFGASGIYSMTLAITPRLVPPQQISKYMALVSSVFALASVAGPLMGGVLSKSGNWKWIFELNAPAGFLALAIIIFFLPSISNDDNDSFDSSPPKKISAANLQRIDLLGVFLLLAASVLVVFSFETAGTQYPWNSGIVIVTLILGSTFFVIFILWERWLQNKLPAREEPVFPPRILWRRDMAAMFLTSFFIGFSFTSVVVNIPQRAQAVYGYSPERAGITLLPLLLSSPLATAFSSFLTSKCKVPPTYLILAGVIVQSLGMGMACSLPTNSLSLPYQQLIFEAIIGTGFGFTLTTTLTLAQIVTAQNDLLDVTNDIGKPAVTLGALTQVRVLGGTLGLAISSTVLNSDVSNRLEHIIGLQEVQNITKSFSAIESLSPGQQRLTRLVFAEGFQRQTIVMAAFSGMALICSLLLIQRRSRGALDTESRSL
ncbi:putative MFS multidrug transporter [Talaromyces proteolyticus]|uniref:MFS multidrug transporter n=1 Tax=Talaromyces proteolyticus TaxID=1131652 RepID=A0AAD4KNK2_9EURO|nr:putative MFS multidrug transporter [Talaromyces proteolyticus]KAH8695587.1 putative MFS multidrug transporter [Talaromyces proteolyticus]